MKNGRTKGEVEAAICNAIIKFEREFMGRGPEDVNAFILNGLVLIKFKGVLTPPERQLANNADGIEMVQAMRQISSHKVGKSFQSNSVKSLEPASREFSPISICK